MAIQTKNNFQGLPGVLITNVLQEALAENKHNYQNDAAKKFMKVESISTGLMNQSSFNQ